MLFNSLDFAFFLPLVFVLYWFVTNKSLKFQNALVVVASYVFYGWWDWRFLSLILFSTIVDYLVGLTLLKQNDQRSRKTLLAISVIVNLGFLGFFKYYNFFLDNFKDAFSFFGQEITSSSLEIILPVGISFYTFQTMSYTIDVYRRKLEPTKDFIAFAAFISFFPQLVAGPIERATNLLPQFHKQRYFVSKQAVEGLRQILWGFFKKVVIADNCARYVNIILCFAFQIYGDFSGYSDIAIGTARLFGFDLKQNFAFPYFSRDIAEFWRRWHISLSTWFRDYLYIPLGGSRGGAWMKVRNIFIIFIVSGFWHGANWTFVFWGVLNAIYFLPLLLTKNNRNNIEIVAKGRLLPSLKEVFLMLITFLLTVLAWIFFRAENVTHAWEIFSKVFSTSLFKVPVFHLDSTIKPLLLLLVIFLVMEWLGREGKFALETMEIKYVKIIRWSVYLGVGLMIFYFGNFDKTEFIYFAF
jgi:D-alanyl-lipoteichoic acid acyltransferase DltB (MBOAT superfamily)